MAIAITIPRLGWNMDEGVFAGWIKQDGDSVQPGDRIFTLEGEKATEEIECLDRGILRIAPSGPKAGDTVAVGLVIGYLTEAGEAAPTANPPTNDTASHIPPVQDRERSIAEQEERDTVGAVSSAPASNRTRPISPRARRVARELGIDWSGIQGSGRTGRIRERDIRAAAESAPTPQRAAGRVSPIRKKIAERMRSSLSTTAPVTLTTTADFSNLVNLRNQFRAVGTASAGIVPGYTDFLLKLVAVALQQHPMLSAHWEGEEIVFPPSLDIGMAVDTEEGLLVPVLRDVPSLGLRALALRARELAEQARQGKLDASAMRGGVFTITNLGAFGIDAFTPIINLPQCAILGVGRIERKPVVIDEQIVIRDQAVLSLTFDHRIVDGAPAALFLQAIRQLLENPGPWLVS